MKLLAMIEASGTMIHRISYQSPLGEMSLLADEDGLLGVYFVGQTYYKRGYEVVTVKEVSTPILAQATDWLTDYFARKNPAVAVPPLKLRGTGFQKAVWKALRDISYGETVTYGELARRLGCRSAQAVGSAIGKNPLSIFVPCHRVVARDGRLTGFSAGLDKKKALLVLEGQSLFDKKGESYVDFC